MTETPTERFHRLSQAWRALTERFPEEWQRIQDIAPDEFAASLISRDLRRPVYAASLRRFRTDQIEPGGISEADLFDRCGTGLAGIVCVIDRIDWLHRRL